MRPIITLTTDLGDNSMHVAIVKGEILKECPDAAIIDISHRIKPRNINEAAFVLKNTFSHFPQGTIHILEVNSLNKKNTRYIAARYSEHIFIGADNGIFSMIFDGQAERMITLSSVNTTFPAGDIFVKAACRLAKGDALEALGASLSDLMRQPVLQPAIYDSSIKASVIYIDNYENVFLNVTRSLFDKVAKGRNAVVSTRTEQITGIGSNYHDVEDSYPVCFFNSIGLLEIAIKNGNASGLLGLHLNDTVLIEFE